MRQAEDKVFIEGILSEIDLKEVTYNKNGADVNALAGMVKVRVDDKDGTLEIPVHVFANEKTKAGGNNPGFESIKRVMNEFTSIAAAGEDVADRVRISGASITMNEYFDQNENLISYPRIRGSFINKVKKDELNPKAEFDTEIVIGNIIPEVDKDGVETGNLKIMGIIPQFGGKVDVVPFIAKNPNAVTFINSSWKEGDTVKIHGKVNFTSKTESVFEEVAFGDPIEKKRTINISELVGTAGTYPLEGDLAFDAGEIRAALAQRQADLEANKAKSMARTKQASAPAQSGFGDGLGF